MIRKKKKLISMLLSASVMALYSCGGGGGSGTEISGNTEETNNQPEIVEIPEITSVSGTASIKFGNGIILQKIYKNSVIPQAKADTTVIVPHIGTDRINITVNDNDDNLVIMDSTVQNPDNTSSPLAEHPFFGINNGGQISNNAIQAVFFTENSRGDLVPNKIEHKVVEININNGTGTLDAKFVKPGTDDTNYEGKDFVFQNLSLFNDLGQIYEEDQNGTTVSYKVLDRGDYFENFTIHFNNVIDIEPTPSQNSAIYIYTTNSGETKYEIPPNATQVGIKFVDKDNTAVYEYSTYDDPNNSTNKIDIVSNATIHDIDITANPGNEITVTLNVNECLKADNNSCVLLDKGQSSFTVYQDISKASDTTGLTVNCFDPRTGRTTSNIGSGENCTFSDPRDASNAGTITLNIPSYYSDKNGDQTADDPQWNGYCKVVVEYPDGSNTVEDTITTADVLCSELSNQTLSWNVPASFKGLGNQNIVFSVRKKYIKLDSNNTETNYYAEIDKLEISIKVNQSPTFD